MVCSVGLGKNDPFSTDAMTAIQPVKFPAELGKQIPVTEIPSTGIGLRAQPRYISRARSPFQTGSVHVEAVYASSTEGPRERILIYDFLKIN